PEARRGARRDGHLSTDPPSDLRGLGLLGPGMGAVFLERGRASAGRCAGRRPRSQGAARGALAGRTPPRLHQLPAPFQSLSARHLLTDTDRWRSCIAWAPRSCSARWWSPPFLRLWSDSAADRRGPISCAVPSPCSSVFRWPPAWSSSYRV